MVAVADPRIVHIERLVAAIDLPIGRWGRDARLVFCNEHFIGWVGRAREDLLGRSVQELFGDAAWAAATPAFEQAFGGRTVRYQRQRADGPAPGRWLRTSMPAAQSRRCSRSRSTSMTRCSRARHSRPPSFA